MYLINSGQTLEVKVQKMTDIIKIRKTESKTVRIIWYFVIIGGIYGTVKSLNSCLHQFFRYPTMDVVTTYERQDAHFPKVTICQNSIHSRKLIERNQPFMLSLVGLLYNSMRIRLALMYRFITYESWPLTNN